MLGCLVGYCVVISVGYFVVRWMWWGLNEWLSAGWRGGGWGRERAVGYLGRPEETRTGYRGPFRAICALVALLYLCIDADRLIEGSGLCAT